MPTPVRPHWHRSVVSVFIAFHAPYYTRFHFKNRSKTSPVHRGTLLISNFMLIVKIYVGEF